MNKSSAKEWLIKAWHSLSGAKLYYDANHYTDVTAVEIHYAVEKTLKSFLAYQNKKIPKTHDLNEVHELIAEFINFTENEFTLIDIITNYHIEESYPALDRKMPSRDEIKEVLEFSESLFTKVCKVLNIDREELK